MSVQLKPDEALELLQLVDPESAARWEVILCTATSAIGAELARIHDCEAGEATHQPGFAGICVPLNPKHPGQALPEGWEDFEFMRGECEEWTEEAKRLASEAEEEKTSPLCQPCKDNGDRVTATHRAPSSTDGKDWTWAAVCCDHARDWWEGSDYPNGEGAPAIEQLPREFTCTACGREESACSAEPCEAVLEDRGELEPDPCPIHRCPPERCPDSCDQGVNPNPGWPGM